VYHLQCKHNVMAHRRRLRGNPSKGLRHQRLLVFRRKAMLFIGLFLSRLPVVLFISPFMLLPWRRPPSVLFKAHVRCFTVGFVGSSFSRSCVVDGISGIADHFT
jgi:hypothetical protein